jgi:hypothetical protein
LTTANALRLALLAALGIVLELFVVKENLLASRENELGAAVDALEYSIGEFHCRLPRNRDIHRNRPMGNDCRSRFPVIVRTAQQGPGPHVKVRQVRCLPADLGKAQKTVTHRLVRSNQAESIATGHPVLASAVRLLPLVFSGSCRDDTCHNWLKS